MKEQNTGEVNGLRDAIGRAIVYLDDDEFTPDNIREARGILRGVCGDGKSHATPDMDALQRKLVDGQCRAIEKAYGLNATT